MDSCLEHKYIQESFKDFKVQVTTIHEDIKTLTDMVSQLIKENAVSNSISHQMRTEVDQIWTCVTEIKENLGEIVLTRERIIGEFNAERELIRKDLQSAFDRIRKNEEINNDFNEKIQQLIMLKEEITASIRTIKFIAGVAPVVISTLIYLIMKLYHI
jgi:hypothetical protein